MPPSAQINNVVSLFCSLEWHVKPLMSTWWRCQDFQNHPLETALISSNAFTVEISCSLVFRLEKSKYLSYIEPILAHQRHISIIYVIIIYPLCTDMNTVAVTHWCHCKVCSQYCDKQHRVWEKKQLSAVSTTIIYHISQLKRARLAVFSSFLIVLKSHENTKSTNVSVFSVSLPLAYWNLFRKAT